MIANIFKFLLSPASIQGPNGFSLQGPAILVFPTILVLATMAVGSFVWLYLDAEKRGKSRLLAILFVLLTGWPFSFIWWLWLRPPVQTHRLLRPA